MWEVEYTREFEEWWDGLTDGEQVAIGRDVDLLAAKGPALGRPLVDTIKKSEYPNLKELRSTYRGEPYRTFFAFDPRRTVILLIGGKKTGDKRFYKTMVPLADRLYAQYLDELREEGLI